MFKEIMTVNFADHMKGKNPQTQGGQHTPNTVNRSEPTPTHTSLTLWNTKGKENTLQAARGRRQTLSRGVTVIWTADHRSQKI